MHKYLIPLFINFKNWKRGMSSKSFVSKCFLFGINFLNSRTKNNSDKNMRLKKWYLIYLPNIIPNEEYPNSTSFCIYSFFLIKNAFLFKIIKLTKNSLFFKFYMSSHIKPNKLKRKNSTLLVFVRVQVSIFTFLGL